jgi:hypothetical protein
MSSMNLVSFLEDAWGGGKGGREGGREGGRREG